MAGMKTLTFILSSLLLVSCGDVPGSPSPDTSRDYKPPQFAPGTCISGTDPTCINVIPTQPKPVPEPVKLSIVVNAKCTVDDLTATCRFEARNETGQIWTAHVAGAVGFDFGDGTRPESSNEPTISHTYKTRDTFGFGGNVCDDRSVCAYTYGTITTVQPK